MRSEPLVSIITIFRNEERFLAEAVESVLAQTYPWWELLLCDDGSTDASPAIAQRYAAEHPDRIRYLHQPDHANRGMSATRNLGLAHASGGMVAFLDADDVWVPEKLTRQVDLLQQHPTAGAVYGPLHVWHGWTGNEADLARDYVQPLGGAADTLVEPPELLIRFLRDEVYTPSGLLFWRDVLREVGGYEESFAGMHSDGTVLAKICVRWPVYASGEVWYRYRQHPDSCRNQAIAAGRDREALRSYLDWIAGYLYSNGYEGSEVAGVVRELLQRQDLSIVGRLKNRATHTLRGNARRARSVAERVLPAPVRGWIGLLTHGGHHTPPAGWAHLGSLRRTTPISQHFGFDRGQPVDRYYIEQFLSLHQADIRGHVLEIADPAYTLRFGGDRVERSDVLHARPGNPEATIIGDLCTGDGIPERAFDCIIMTQVLPFLWDVPAAIETAHRALRPGGVLLATAPGISHVSRYDADRWGDFWRFTTQSLRRLFEVSFARDAVEVRTYGNALTATAFLHGIATHELRRTELDEQHPDYEVSIAVRAVRAPAPAPAPAP